MFKCKPAPVSLRQGACSSSPSGVVLLYFEHRPGLCNVAVERKARSKLPILTLKEAFVSGVNFFTNLHTKTGHFFAFFGILFVFSAFCFKTCLFVKKISLFSSFLKPPPPFSAQKQGCLKSPHPQKHTKIHLFGQIILPFYAF